MNFNNLLQEHYPNISFVGDVMFDRDIKKKIDSNIFSEVTPYIQFMNFGVCNLETPITINKKQFDKTSFATEKLPDNFPFDVVNLANNHIYDSGLIGVENTLSYLNSRGILSFGSEYSSCSVKTICNKKIGFMGYCCNNFSTSNAKEYKDFDISFNFKKFKRDYDSLKTQIKCDYIVVSLHWGEEYQKENFKQIELAHRLIDEYNVDFIYGHHPHVQQKIEKYKGKLIAYSLGNFLFQHIENDTKETRKGKILQIEFSPKMKYVEIDTVCEGPDFKPKVVEIL
jgi:poly-gamma-glutamate synthesis protein (capsule biosynthesis protein)